jgi:predicted nucleotidyltransferase
MSTGSSDVERNLGRMLQEPEMHGVVSAYLFGSHAAGRAHRESDVDVGVLLRWATFPTHRSRFHERVRLSGRLSGAVGCEVDVVLLNDAPPPLGRRIVTEGRRMYCTDEEADRAYVRDVQLRAADLEPFLRHAARLKLRASGRS